MRIKVLQRDEKGFTLLETLVALAILSVASLALFQSTGALLRVSDRAVSAGERTLDEAIARETFRQSIAELALAWPEQEAYVFKGERHRFSGLSTAIPSAQGEALIPFTFLLEAQGAVGVDLNIIAADTTWTLKRFALDSAAFSYLGMDHTWYETWPPAQIPAPGFFDDERFILMPQLPLAIRLRGTAGGDVIDWVASTSGRHELPYREELNDDEL